MKKLLLLSLLLVATNVRGQLYLDVTKSPYSANATCSTDAGPLINQAITDALNQSVNSYAAGSTIYFPPGCYLINTEILDPGTLANGHGTGIALTYLGFGRAVLQAGSQLTGAIVKFGDDTHTPVRRHLTTLKFECASNTGIDGIDIDGLDNSEFDDIEIRDCVNGINTVGSNSSNRYGISIEGGLIAATTSNANGISVGPGANFWTIKGMRVISTAGTSTGIGIEIEGAGTVCAACDVEGFDVGLAAGQVGINGGVEISGGYFENNRQSHIRMGSAAAAGLKVQGASIHGAYLNGSSTTTYCIDLQQVDGFSVYGNFFNNCATNNIRGLADQTSPFVEGADNGIVGPNSVTGGGVYSLLGNNITFIAPTCVSSSSPAACGYTSSGIVALPVGGNNLVVNASFVSATSRITINEDMTLGSSFSPAITCNTTGGRTYSVTAKTPGTSFTITSSTAPTSHPACLVFSMTN